MGASSSGSLVVEIFVRSHCPFTLLRTCFTSQVDGRWPIAAGQTDFAPTLLASLGIDPSRLPYVGRNLLGQAADVPIVRPYGDWLDRTHLFVSRNAAERGGECYGAAAAHLVDPSLCRSANELAVRTRDISRFVVTEQLQQRLGEAPR